MKNNTDSNTVYSSKGMIPALTTITGGGTEQIKVLKRLDSMRTENIIPYRQTDRQTDRQSGIIVLGKIGNTEYQNNDRCKVLSRKGLSKTIYAGACHGNSPMVIRQWKRK